MAVTRSKDKMTPEQLKYIREWAKDGNQARYYDMIPSWCLHVTTRGRSNTERHLDTFAMTIARLADALEITGDVCDGLYNDLCASPGAPLVKAKASSFMAEIANLHEGLLG